MIILGIDPGFGKLGCAVIKKTKGKEEVIYSCCFTTDKKTPYEERLLFLAKKIDKILKKFKPDVLVMEKVFFSKNQKTAIQVAEMRGIILYLAISKNIPVKEFTPLEVKMALTGYGRAEKDQVQKMVEAITRIKKVPKNDDEIDAIAIALTYSSRCY